MEAVANPRRNTGERPEHPEHPKHRKHQPEEEDGPTINFKKVPRCQNRNKATSHVPITNKTTVVLKNGPTINLKKHNSSSNPTRRATINPRNPLPPLLPPIREDRRNLNRNSTTKTITILEPKTIELKQGAPKIEEAHPKRTRRPKVHRVSQIPRPRSLHRRRVEK